MSRLGLLSAGFSAILGTEVVLQQHGATFSIHDVFKETYVMKPPAFRPPSPEQAQAEGFSAILGRDVVLQEGGATSSIHDVLKQTHVMKLPGFGARSPDPVYVHDTFPIFVRGYFGFDDTLTLQVTEKHSVYDMKLQILEKVNIAFWQFDLMQYAISGKKRLDDDRTVKDCGLQPRSIIYFALRTNRRGPLTVSTDELALEFESDFTFAKYKLPDGWNRFAVRVLGRYENDDWLGLDGIWTSQASEEWPVSYHGTDLSSAEKIAMESYKVEPRDKFEKGIYTSPSLEMVERLYAKEFPYHGKRYKVALQNRVNPDRNGHLEIISASQTKVGADYWLSPNEDDVRPYGLLFREVGQTESEQCSLQ